LLFNWSHNAIIETMSEARGIEMAVARVNVLSLVEPLLGLVVGVDVEDEDVEVVVAVFSVKEFEQQEES